MGRGLAKVDIMSVTEFGGKILNEFGYLKGLWCKSLIPDPALDLNPNPNPGPTSFLTG